MDQPGNALDLLNDLIGRAKAAGADAADAVAVDGMSLTVNAVRGNRFTVNIIPHTQDRTMIGSYKAGNGTVQVVGETSAHQTTDSTNVTEIIRAAATSSPNAATARRASSGGPGSPALISASTAERNAFSLNGPASLSSCGCLAYDSNNARASVVAPCAVTKISQATKITWGD